MKIINKLQSKYNNIPKPAKASLWFVICSFLQKGISVITTPIFTRLLNTTEYGNYNVFNSWLGIITVIVCLDLYAGVYTQGLVKYEEDRSKFSSSLQGLTLLLISGWTVIYLITRNFWNNVFELSTVQMLAMFLMIWATATFRFWSAEKRVSYDYKLLVIITLLVSLAKPLIGIVLVIHSDDKVTARILGLVLVELIAYTWTFFYQMHNGKAFYNKSYWIYAIKFNLPLIPHYLAQIVLNSSDRLMIKSITGASEAGIYSLAYSLSQIMQLFNTALLQTLEPWIYQKIKTNKTADISKIAYLALVIIAGLNLLLISFAPEAVAIFAPEEYYDAIWVIPPVAMSVYFGFSYVLFANFEFYFEKTKFIMFASLFGAVLNVFLNKIFIGIFGYYAAGYTTLICYIIFALGHYCVMNKICRAKLKEHKVYNFKILCLISGIFTIAGFAIMCTYRHPIIRYTLIGVVLIVVIMKRKTVFDVVEKFIAIRKNK